MRRRGRRAEEAATWNPYEQSVSYVEQFRTSALVSYLEIIRTAHGGTPETEFKTINFDKEKKREFELGDISRRCRRPLQNA